MLMSIGAAASYLGISVVTLRRWDRSRVLKPAWKTVGGHRRYDLADLSRRIRAEEGLPGKTVAYARVSSHDQSEDLERQAQRLKV